MLSDPTTTAAPCPYCGGTDHTGREHFQFVMSLSEEEDVVTEPATAAERRLPNMDAATVYETDIPGLYDVQMPDGTWRRDMTLGQLRSMVFDGTPILPPVLRDA